MLKRQIRAFASSIRLLNRGFLADLIVLKQLRDQSKLNKPSSILILEPEKLKKKEALNRIPGIPKISTPEHPTFIPTLFEEELGKSDDASYIKLINDMRVHEKHVSERRFKQLSRQLSKSFTSKQLQEYIKHFYSDVDYKGPQYGYKGKPKARLTKIIIQHLWEIKLTGELTAVEDFLASTEIKLQKRDLFLLLHKEGSLLKHLSRTGCQILFDSQKDTIRFKGTESQINSANIMLNSMLGSCYQQELDLGEIRSMFEEKFGEFNLQKMSTLFQAYFEDLGENKYRLTTLTQKQNERTKRLLLWYLDSNRHVKNRLEVPSTIDILKMQFLPFKDDEALNWFNRLKSLSRLDSEHHSVSQTVDQQLEIYLDESVINDKDLHFHDIDELKSFLSPPEINELVNLETTEDTTLTSAEIEKIYSNLSDFEEHQVGSSKDKLLPPTFTASLGHILFEKPETSLVSSAKDLPSNYVFNTAIPLITDRILSLPPFSNPDLTVRDIQELRISDPYDYFIQLKFQPSLYDKESKDAPAVEIWINLNQYGKPEMSSMRVLTVENEKNWFVPLPTKASDMKLSSQMIGDLFKATEHEDLDEDPVSSIEDLLNMTTSQYAKFRNQPGLDEFLRKSTLDFSGRIKPKVHETLTLEIDGNKINYQYICLNYRRQLEFLFKDKLLQLSIIEGGSLGGRSSEVAVMGLGFDQDALEELVKDTVSLIDQM